MMFSTPARTRALRTDARIRQSLSKGGAALAGNTGVLWSVCAVHGRPEMTEAQLSKKAQMQKTAHDFQLSMIVRCVSTGSASQRRESHEAAHGCKERQIRSE